MDIEGVDQVAADGSSEEVHGAVDGFLRILTPHLESDVTITCYRMPGLGCSGPVEQVHFFCHRAVLRRHCNFFADTGDCVALGNACAEPTAKRRRTQHELNADDKVVFEVLRYVYCGKVHIHQGFRTNFRQLLAVADCLGVGGRGVASSSGARAILADPGVEHWLSALSTDTLLDFLQDLPNGSTGNGIGWPYGIDSRRDLLAKLNALHLNDFSVDGLRRLGERAFGLLELHPGLVKLRVVSMAGELVAELQIDWAVTVADIATQLRTRLNTEAELRLTFGSEVLDASSTLQEAGAPGRGAPMTVGLVRQPGHLSRCRHPAVVGFIRKDGPNLGRTFLTCAIGSF
jgi:hypothetical protein